MTLERLGPYIILELEWDMAYGPNVYASCGLQGCAEISDPEQALYGVLSSCIVPILQNARDVE